jgi:hypothetical protein
MMEGCGKDGCNDIGCFDGLEVRFSPAIPVEAEITIRLSGDVERSCTQPVVTTLGPCSDAGVALDWQTAGELAAVKFQGAQPREVTLEILDQDSHVLRSTSKTVSYEMIQPNGPECAPTCRQGKLVIDWTQP